MSNTDTLEQGYEPFRRGDLDGAMNIVTST